MDFETILSAAFTLLLLAMVFVGTLTMIRWRRLSAVYATKLRPTSKKTPVTRVLVNPTIYAKAWCRVEPGDEGVLFFPYAQFRLLYKPALVPWSDIKGRPSRGMFMEAVEIVTTRVPEARLKILAPTASSLREALESRGRMVTDSIFEANC